MTGLPEEAVPPPVAYMYSPTDEYYTLKLAVVALCLLTVVTMGLSIANRFQMETGFTFNTINGITGGPVSKKGTVSLRKTGVTPGEYNSANIKVDSYGRLSFAEEGRSEFFALPEVITYVDEVDMHVALYNTAIVWAHDKLTTTYTVYSKDFDLKRVLTPSNGMMMFLSVSGRNSLTTDPPALMGATTTEIILKVFKVQQEMVDPVFTSTVKNTLTPDTTSSWVFDVMVKCPMETDAHLTSAVKTIIVGNSSLVSDYSRVSPAELRYDDTIRVEVEYSRPSQYTPTEDGTVGQTTTATHEAMLLGFRMFTNE